MCAAVHGGGEQEKSLAAAAANLAIQLVSISAI
jgi:hypothetical protein